MKSTLPYKQLIDEIRALLEILADTGAPQESDPWSRPQIQAKVKRLLAGALSEIHRLWTENDLKKKTLQECAQELACRCEPAWTDRNLHAPDCCAWIVDRIINPTLFQEEEESPDSTSMLPDEEHTELLQEAADGGAFPTGSGAENPHSAMPGYVAERKAKLGGYVVIFDRRNGADRWIDDEMRWIVIHMPSSNHVGVRNKSHAYAVMTGIAAASSLSEAQQWADILPDSI